MLNLFLGKWNFWFLFVLWGVSGFFGIYGMWFSMMYFFFVDVIVIIFFGFGVVGVICYFVFWELFIRVE